MAGPLGPLLLEVPPVWTAPQSGKGLFYYLVLAVVPSLGSGPQMGKLDPVAPTRAASPAWVLCPTPLSCSSGQWSALYLSASSAAYSELERLSGIEKVLVLVECSVPMQTCLAPS